MFRPRLRSKDRPKKPSAYRSADHQRLVALINSMTDAVLAVSSEGKIMLSNGAALNLFDTNSLIGKNVASILHLYDRQNQPLDILSILKRARHFSSREFRLKSQDRHAMNLEISISPVYIGFGFADGGFVFLIRDITSYKSLEEEREEFISVASHELRTPIAISEGNVDNALFLAQKQGSPEAVLQSLEMAHDQIVFLGSLINDLAMLSRAQSASKQVDTKNLDSDEIIKHLVDSYTPKAKEKHLKLLVRTSGGVKFDSSELYVKEILQNFMTNAIKYTEKGVIEVSSEKAGDQIKFTIKDSGIGISKNERTQLFSKFFRSEDPRVQNLNGTGLGLYVSAKLANLIKGKIEVQTDLGKGSVFSLALPLRVSAAGSSA